VEQHANGNAMADCPDLSGLNFAQLEQLRARIDERVREMRETEGPTLLHEFGEKAAALGLTVEELVAGMPKRRGRPAKERDEA
jgi:hypothetical protein